MVAILGNDGQNYSSNFYRINDWYKAWLPDDAHIKQLHDTKTVYDVRIRYSNNTNATYSFHGPRGKCDVLFIPSVRLLICVVKHVSSYFVHTFRC